MAKLVGSDKIGKLIRLNRPVLDIGRNAYATIVFWGDLHLGHPQCNREKAVTKLKYSLDKHHYVLGMGDFLECGLCSSVGDSVYKQRLNPQEQMEDMIEMLQPLADAGLLLGIHEGNHEQRITKVTGLDVTKNMARILGVPYLGYAVWHYIKVGNQTYSMYSYHGKSGSRFKHTKLKAAVDVAAYFEADIIAMGHVHDLAIETIRRQRVNKRKRTVEERKVHIVLTGAYLEYDKTYAQAAGYPPAGIGSPKIKLNGKKWSIHGAL